MKKLIIWSVMALSAMGGIQQSIDAAPNRLTGKDLQKALNTKIAAANKINNASAAAAWLSEVEALKANLQQKAPALFTNIQKSYETAQKKIQAIIDKAPDAKQLKELVVKEEPIVVKEIEKATSFDVLDKEEKASEAFYAEWQSIYDDFRKNKLNTQDKIESALNKLSNAWKKLPVELLTDDVFKDINIDYSGLLEDLNKAAQKLGAKVVEEEIKEEKEEEQLEESLDKAKTKEEKEKIAGTLKAIKAFYKVYDGVESDFIKGKLETPASIQTAIQKLTNAFEVLEKSEIVDKSLEEYDDAVDEYFDLLKNMKKEAKELKDTALEQEIQEEVEEEKEEEQLEESLDKAKTEKEKEEIDETLKAIEAYDKVSNSVWTDFTAGKLNASASIQTAIQKLTNAFYILEKSEGVDKSHKKYGYASDDYIWILEKLEQEAKKLKDTALEQEIQEEVEETELAKLFSDEDIKAIKQSIEKEKETQEKLKKQAEINAQLAQEALEKTQVDLAKLHELSNKEDITDKEITQLGDDYTDLLNKSLVSQLDADMKKQIGSDNTLKEYPFVNIGSYVAQLKSIMAAGQAALESIYNKDRKDTTKQTLDNFTKKAPVSLAKKLLTAQLKYITALMIAGEKGLQKWSNISVPDQVRSRFQKIFGINKVLPFEQIINDPTFLDNSYFKELPYNIYEYVIVPYLGLDIVNKAVSPANIRYLLELAGLSSLTEDSKLKKLYDTAEKSSESLVSSFESIYEKPTEEALKKKQEELKGLEAGNNEIRNIIQNQITALKTIASALLSAEGAPLKHIEYFANDIWGRYFEQKK